ncbi:MAG: sodium/proton-translocating pyrophosphatase [Candidatus Saccharibacteria bacterium]|nr:sodium/proton-translocating pyrophosphatase [Candidatus Saccharibacteria bacterium]
MLVYSFIAIGVCAIALFAASHYYSSVKTTAGDIEVEAKAETASENVYRKMLELAGIIRDGANEFMKTQYRYIIVVLIGVTLFNALFIELSTGVTLLLGALMSSCGCIMSMKAATYANVVTAYVAKKTKSIRITGAFALLGGAVPGLCISAFGLLGFVLVRIVFGISRDAVGYSIVTGIACNPSTQRFVAYSFGCSMIALFNRVSGGIFTKAADMSSDLVGKVVIGVDEDDYRIPSVAADFIGDNVNDVGGNGSDLLESYVAAIASVVMAGVDLAKTDAQAHAVASFAIAIAASGLLASLVALASVLVKVDKGLKKILADPDVQLTKEDSTRSLKFLDSVMLSSAFITIVSTIIFAFVFFGNDPLEGFKMGWISPAVAPIIGIVSGILITKITEYYTSLASKAVEDTANNAPHGAAFLVTSIDAWGYISVFTPVLIIVVSGIIAYLVCGMFGIGCTAIGMLSFVTSPVSIDAFGPIADNAGGIVESCIKDSKDASATRKVTDVCDAEGNTRAAVAKGFAIGGAAGATLSLNFTYLTIIMKYNISPESLSLANPFVTYAATFGGAFVCLFMGWLLMNTKAAARSMEAESLRQLMIDAPVTYNEKGEKQIDYSKGAIFLGKMLPDYLQCIRIATQEAVHRMVKPTLVVILAPVIVGFVLGPAANGGMITGATIMAVSMAIFMGNSGGIADNAKKFIEAGMLEGHLKGSYAHKMAVEGDTIGDPRKDVVGVDLDILIKLSATVSITLAPLFCQFNVLGLFGLI